MDIKTAILKSKEESDENLLRLSVSKVKTFDGCKAQYRYNYIEKLPQKDWEHLLFGKFMHDVLENFHIKLRENNNDINLLRPIMTEAFKAGKEKYKLSKEHLQEAFGLINKYLELVENQLETKTAPEILNVEKGFYIDIDGKVLLNGFIDRVQRDVDGVLHVADYKTTKDKRYLKDFFQLLTYTFVLMLEDTTITKIRASYILLRHNFEYLTKEYTRKDILPVAAKFLKYADEISEEKLWRPSPTNLCKFCSFLDVCDSGRNYLENTGKIKPSFGASKW